MQLSYLLKEITPIPIEMDRTIVNLALDSRRVTPGSLFLAVPGTKTHGNEYISQAVNLGAAAVLFDANIAMPPSWLGNVPLLPIASLSHKMGGIAARFYHHPAAQLRLIGVTGTSGKTSCTQLIAQALELQHISCGIVGTLGNGFYNALDEAKLTTPDAITLQSTLRHFVEQGAKATVMEVSSHSIDQGRVLGMHFDVGVFTNLSQDHLDYHQTMEAYAAVKKSFLAELPTKQLVINADDHYGRQWIAELSSRKPIIGFSTKEETTSLPVPMIYSKAVELTLEGIKAHISTPWGEGELVLPLIGQFNLSNGLAVLGTLCLLDIPLNIVLQSLAALQPVPGRMQILGGNGKPLIVVDYAHKPDALEKVLQAMRGHTRGKLCCVFGCGGERDRSKRPLMAKIAEKWADQVIVTNDNPRHEEPQDIAAEIVQGFAYPKRAWIELDRSKAIQKSLQWASAEDCVLIAGKGAECYQQIGDNKIPFDDVAQVLKFLAG